MTAQFSYQCLLPEPFAQEVEDFLFYFVAHPELIGVGKQTGEKIKNPQTGIDGEEVWACYLNELMLVEKPSTEIATEPVGSLKIIRALSKECIAEIHNLSSPVYMHASYSQFLSFENLSPRQMITVLFGENIYQLRGSVNNQDFKQDKIISIYKVIAPTDSLAIKKNTVEHSEAFLKEIEVELERQSLLKNVPALLNQTELKRSPKI